MFEKAIPFNRMTFDHGEMARIREATRNGHISGDGPFAKMAEKILSDIHDGSRVLLVPSCSHALELAARLIGFEPGDEVIVPSFTFVTSVSSFVSHGATPIFCDIDPMTLGLDLEKARKLITSKTKAIVLVHYGGVPANPQGFARLAEEHDLILIEDNAHGLGGESKGRKLGTFGAMSTISFHETKNISCGEGGALVINDPQYIERAEILREKGTDRSRFFRGQVDKYTWQDLGSSWVLSDLLAAILYAQLCNFDKIQERRMNLWGHYYRELADWALDNSVGLAETKTETAHLFYTLMGNSQNQVGLIQHLKLRGINAAFHYQPLHLSPFGSQFSSWQDMSVTTKISDSLVRLPLYGAMKISDLNRVVAAVKAYSAPIQHGW